MSASDRLDRAEKMTAFPSEVNDSAPEREIARDQALRAGKPEAIVDKIVEGKMEKFYAQHCLLEQPFVKDPDKTIGELMHEAVGRIGENMHIKRFTRYVLGEDN